MAVVHFKSQQERLAYLKGEFEEIKPIEAKTAKAEHKNAEIAEKPQKKAAKSKKRTKKDKKNDAVQAE